MTGIESLSKKDEETPLISPSGIMKNEAYQGDNGFNSHEGISKKPGSQGSHLWTSIQKTLFIVGSCVVVFIALRNSLTLHLQSVWGASGNFWQHQWDKVLDMFDNDHYNLIVYGTMAAQYIGYWSLGFFYIIMDVTLRPEVFRRYKIQPGTNEPVSTKRLLKVIAVVHFNQLVVAYSMICVAFRVLQLRGYDSGPQLPSFSWVVLELAVFVLVEEICFYYSHRLLHHRFFYKRIHKIHHEWQSPISITAIYAHPIEHVLSNVLPVFMGPCIMGSHLSTVWLWQQIAQISTLNAHSGYHLPFAPSNEAHDYHHLKFNQCYGVLGVLDFLHGTDSRFRDSKSFLRHIMSLTLTPVRVLFPDADKSMPGAGKDSQQGVLKEE